MGHAMDNVMQDMLIRWHRMMGDNTLWMPGTDHAGIATQAVVEKRLFELEGKTRHDIGREALVEQNLGLEGRIPAADHPAAPEHGLLLRLGAGAFHHGSRLCARCPGGLLPALSRRARSTAATVWSTGTVQLQTAVSDDEIVYEKIQGHFWHIRYPIIDPKPGEPEYVTVATTRPETMLGDTAVAVPPRPGRRTGEAESGFAGADRRVAAQERKAPAGRGSAGGRRRKKSSASAIFSSSRRWPSQGRKVLLPLLEREMPLILDEWAKPELGSGCVKITPAHDPNDYDVWTRHKDEIDIINILNPDGTLNENAGPYAGLDRFEARDKVVADLESQGLMERSRTERSRSGIRTGPKRLSSPISPSSGSSTWGMSKDGILCGRGTEKEFTSRRVGPGRHRRHRPGLEDADRAESDLLSRPCPLRRHLRQLAGGEEGLVHQPPALVGTPHSDLAQQFR